MPSAAMSARLLCSLALFAVLPGPSEALRRGAGKTSARSDSTCPGPLATGPISPTEHVPPVEGSKLTKMAFSSCYRPQYQINKGLWWDVRAFLPEVFVWLGDNMYHDGPDMESKRQAYNVARNNTFYSQFGPPASPKIPVTGTWDDHDFAANNKGKHFNCKRETQDEFVYAFGIPSTDPRHPDYTGGDKQEGVYSSVMYAKSDATPVPPTPAPPTPAPVQAPPPEIIGSPTCGGNTEAEARCVFPFTYQGKNYSQCITEHHDQPWCYTTVDGKWGNCNCDAPTCDGNADGASCQFPFTYQGQTYSHCITEHSDQQWCYTTNEGKWGNCNCGTTCGGNAEGASCQFPFTYQGHTYSQCIDDHHDQPWCYTTVDGKWGNCKCDASLVQASTSENGVHLINIDARYFRSPTFSQHGACERGESEMLGDTQWAWLDAELARPSEVKVIASGIQVLPPLASSKARPKSEYCAYDGEGQTFDSAIARLNETGKVGTFYEAWSEIPLERERLLRKCQKSLSDGNAKAIVFISGDQHWGEIQAKIMPEDPVFGSSQVLYEVTASGIDQHYNHLIVNDNRLQPDAGAEFNAVTTHVSAMANDVRTDKCPDAHHVCNAQANYGQIEVDFTTGSLFLRIKTPHHEDTTASEVKVSLK